MKKLIGLLLGVALLCSSTYVYADDDDSDRRKGLSRKAKKELVASGATKYLGEFDPAISIPIGDGWVKHTFDPGLDEGPICVAGSPYSVFSKAQNPKKLLILQQGGGACWQDFYFCNLFSESQEPPPPPVGIWSETSPDGSVENPVGDWSILYMPYCDGSVFTGDNAVVDPAFQAWFENAAGLPPGTGPSIRFHRGLRNVSAGIDLAHDLFPKAKKIAVTGSSAGGVGAAGFAPFLVRFKYHRNRQLTVFNDAGPVATNLLDVPAILARAADWDFGKFYPESCTECSDMGQSTALIKWRLDNDSTIRESFYSTDGDETNRFFLKVPTQEQYRALLLAEHGALNAAHPKRYKRFIRSGTDSHTALQTPLYYDGTANGVPLVDWFEASLEKPRKNEDDSDSDSDSDGKKKKSIWVDIVEDFVPLP